VDTVGRRLAAHQMRFLIEWLLRDVIKGHPSQIALREQLRKPYRNRAARAVVKTVDRVPRNRLTPTGSGVPVGSNAWDAVRPDNDQAAEAKEGAQDRRLGRILRIGRISVTTMRTTSRGRCLRLVLLGGRGATSYEVIRR
jgi:hypothetical protein